MFTICALATDRELGRLCSNNTIEKSPNLPKCWEIFKIFAMLRNLQADRTMKNLKVVEIYEVFENFQKSSTL